MGKKLERSMVPALTFGTAKSKVEVQTARRGKISLRGSGVFTLDELDQVVQQIGQWVRQQRPLVMPPPTVPPARPMAPAGSSDFHGEPFVPDAASLEVLD